MSKKHDEIIFEEPVYVPIEEVLEEVTPPMVPFDVRKDLREVFVLCDLLNIRDGEGKEFDILCQVPKKTVLVVDDDLVCHGDWLYVKVKETGVEGFCMKEFVSEVEDE